MSPLIGGVSRAAPNSVVSGSPLSSDLTYYAALPPYNVKPDGKTVTDAAITSGQAALSSANAGFTAADQGKLVVVVGAGAAGAHLYTTISSVSNGVATLATPASTTVSGAEAFYATDFTTACQQIVTDAAAIRGTAVFPEGDIGITAPPATSQPITLRGQGVKELYGATSADGYNFPTVAPYLKGTVFVVCAPNVDGLQLFGQGLSQNARGFGIRFAGRFKNTGHGLNATPTTANMGIMGAVTEDVKVFGHDGDHYGFLLQSPALNRYVGLRAYGGGGARIYNGVTSDSPGNLAILDCYTATIIGGSAHGLFLDGSGAGGTFQYCVFTRWQSWVYAPASQPAGTSPPTNAQKTLQTSGGNTMLSMLFIGVDFETNVGSTATFPSGSACWRTADPSVALGNTAMQGSPVSGTAYQNLTGKLQVVTNQFLLQPLAAASASTTLNGATAVGAKTIVVASATGIAVGSVLQIDTGTNMEFAIVIGVVGTTITLYNNANWGLGLAHATGATVAVGAACAIQEAAPTNSFPTGRRAGHIGLAIGSNPQQVSMPGMPVPSSYYWRILFGNATRTWTDNVGLTG